MRTLFIVATDILFGWIRAGTTLCPEGDCAPARTQADDFDARILAKGLDRGF